MSSLRKAARDLLREALAKFENGEKWITNNYANSNGYCSIGAIRSILGPNQEIGRVGSRAMQELARHVPNPAFELKKSNYHSIIVWFNDDSRSFRPIEKLFKKAIRSLR